MCSDTFYKAELMMGTLALAARCHRQERSVHEISGKPHLLFEYNNCYNHFIPSHSIMDPCNKDIYGLLSLVERNDEGITS